MKKKMVLRSIVSFVLAFSMAFGLPFSLGGLPELSASAAELESSDYIYGSYKHAPVSSGYSADVQDRYVFSDQWFFSDGTAKAADSTVLKSLATMSLKLSLASGSCANAMMDMQAGRNKGRRLSDNVRELISELGFEDIYVNGDYDAIGQPDSVGVAIAHKAIKEKESGEERELIIIVPRSYGYDGEWESNVTIGATGDHRGFEAAASKMLIELNSYIVEYLGDEDRGSLKLWTSGYSRGAAIVQAFSAVLSNTEIEPENIFAFAYGTPAGLLLSDYSAGSLSFLHSFLGEGDIFAQILPQDWGLGRGGDVNFLRMESPEGFALYGLKDLSTLLPSGEGQPDIGKLLNSLLEGWGIEPGEDANYNITTFLATAGAAASENAKDAAGIAENMESFVITLLGMTGALPGGASSGSSQEGSDSLDIAAAVSEYIVERDSEMTKSDFVRHLSSALPSEFTRKEFAEDGAQDAVKRALCFGLDMIYDGIISQLGGYVAQDDIVPAATALLLCYSYIASPNILHVPADEDGKRTGEAVYYEKDPLLIKAAAMELGPVLERALKGALENESIEWPRPSSEKEYIREGIEWICAKEEAGEGSTDVRYYYPHLEPLLKALSALLLRAPENDDLSPASAALSNAVTIYQNGTNLFYEHDATVMMPLLEEEDPLYPLPKKRSNGPSKAGVVGTVEIAASEEAEAAEGEEGADAEGEEKSESLDKAAERGAESYSDVDRAAWYAPAVGLAMEAGLMRGTDDTHFSPSSECTREQAMTVLARISGAEAETTAEGLKWAIESGVSDGSEPKAGITREQFVTMLWRLLHTEDEAEALELSGYADAGSISTWAAEALSWAVVKGYIQGYEDGMLHPGDFITRAQLAAVLTRISL